MFYNVNFCFRNQPDAERSKRGKAVLNTEEIKNEERESGDDKDEEKTWMLTLAYLYTNPTMRCEFCSAIYRQVSYFLFFFQFQ